MIFCETDLRQVGYLRCILGSFEAVSGLKVNLTKSEIFQVREVSYHPLLANILGCKIGSWPSSCVSLPLRAKFKSKKVWDLVMEKISRRLDFWKGPFLLKGGRLTLVKSVLSSIPNYYFSLFTALCSIVQNIETYFINFLWNDSKEHHRFYLVNWKVVCSLVDKGGLRIQRIKTHNQALLAKWL